MSEPINVKQDDLKGADVTPAAVNRVGGEMSDTEIDINRLIDAECYAYTRWLRAGSLWWYGLLLGIHARLKAHPEYRGVR